MEPSGQRKVTSVYEVEAITNLTAQLAELTKMVQSGTLLQSLSCGLCGSNHSSEHCPMSLGLVQYMSNFNWQ